LGGSEITAAVRDEVVAVEGTRLDVRVVEVLVAADPQARFGRHDERKLRIRGAVETHVVDMRLGGDPPSEHEELDLLARMAESDQVGAPELEGARQLVDPRLPVIVPAMGGLVGQGNEAVVLPVGEHRLDRRPLYGWCASARPSRGTVRPAHEALPRPLSRASTRRAIDPTRTPSAKVGATARGFVRLPSSG